MVTAGDGVERAQVHEVDDLSVGEGYSRHVMFEARANWRDESRGEGFCGFVAEFAFFEVCAGPVG